jgi:PTS system galactitol-specific IIA component
MLVFNEDLVVLKFDAVEVQAVIEELGSRLAKQGLVKPEYSSATYTRELEHPTGLPTNPFCIAFPHADADGVIQSALAFASLERPVSFRNMADPDERLDVHLVFLLANKNPEEQIQTLRDLALLFSQPEKLVELRDLAQPAEVVSWLTCELHLG